MLSETLKGWPPATRTEDFPGEENPSSFKWTSPSEKMPFLLRTRPQGDSSVPELKPAIQGKTRLCRETYASTAGISVRHKCARLEQNVQVWNKFGDRRE